MPWCEPGTSMAQGDDSPNRRPQLRSSGEVATAYRTLQQRVDALLSKRIDLSDRAVPACPGWTVHHAVCHLVGTADDLLAGNLHDAGSETWTGAQIDRLSCHSVDELLGKWAESAGLVAERLSISPKLYGAQVVFDTWTHEHDIRGAIAEPGGRDTDLVSTVALGYLLTMTDRSIRRKQLPSVRLTVRKMGTVLLGDHEKNSGCLSVALTEFEVLRAFGGRRSAQQLLGLSWEGDARALLPLFCTAVVRPPSTSLLE